MKNGTFNLLSTETDAYFDAYKVLEDNGFSDPRMKRLKAFIEKVTSYNNKVYPNSTLLFNVEIYNELSDIKTVIPSTKNLIEQGEIDIGRIEYPVEIFIISYNKDNKVKAYKKSLLEFFSSDNFEKKTLLSLKEFPSESLISHTESNIVILGVYDPIQIEDKGVGFMQVVCFGVPVEKELKIKIKKILNMFDIEYNNLDNIINDE